LKEITQLKFCFRISHYTLSVLPLQHRTVVCKNFVWMGHHDGWTA